MRPEAELDALETKYAALIRAPYAVECVDEVPDPHPFMVGTAHVEAAAKRHGGILGDAALCAHGCYMPGCGKPHTAHVWNTIVFIRMPGPMGNSVPEDLAQMLREVKAQADADRVEGFGFLVPGRTWKPYRRTRG